MKQTTFRQYVKAHSLLLFFALTCIYSWLIWLPLLINVQQTGNTNSPLWWLHYLGGFGPLLAAFTMTSLLEGKRGVLTLITRQAGVGAPKKWIVIAAVLPFAFFAVAMVLEGLMSGNWSNPAGLLASDKLPGFSFLFFVLVEIIAFGYGEETGWRGYALPRLQDKWNPLAAALLVAAPWAFWHIPTFFYNENMMTMGFGGAMGWLVSIVTGSVILSWIFNNSKGSIMPVALFHGLLDVVFVSQAVAGKLENYMGALITFFAIGLMIVVWKTKNKVTSKQLVYNK